MEKYRAQKIEPPSPDRIERMVRSAVHTYDERLCETVSQRLPLEIHAQLKALLLPSRVAREPEAHLVPALLQELRADAGPASLQTVQQELDKLDLVRALRLPPAVFVSVPPKVLQSYRQRAAVEALTCCILLLLALAMQERGQ